jgi:hypothetical protein
LNKLFILNNSKIIMESEDAPMDEHSNSNSKDKS